MTQRDDSFGNKAEAFEAFDDIPTNPNLGDTIGDVIHRRYSRREAMRGALAVTAANAHFGSALIGSTVLSPGRAAAVPGGRFAFEEIEAGVDETHHIAEGYNADILLRWGDPIFADAPDFDPMNQSEASQLKQFGYNCDYVGFVPLGEGRGLLCVNHEYSKLTTSTPTRR